MAKMNDKKAHAQLKKINSERNLIGVGGYRDSRRIRSEQNEKLNTAITEMNKATDELKIQESEDV